MCEPHAYSKPNPKGGYDIDTVCTISGKPITISNEYGMFCEDMCEYDEHKDMGDAFKQALSGLDDESIPEEERLNDLMNGLHDIFKRFGDGK